MNRRITKCAIEEIENKRWGITEQFLEIHELIYEHGKPKIERIDSEKEDGTAVIYFPVKNEKFYFAVYLKTAPEVEVVGVDVASNTCVYFKAYSEVFDFDQLSSMTLLKPSGGHTKGSKRNRTVNKDSVVRFEPNPEPDEFEDKLRKLLDFLEQDSDGVKKLADDANGFIQAAIICHNGNSMLGGPHINKESIHRMNALNLAIDFDIYAEGNHWK